MNPECPLRYSISDWRQLSKCKSNNSRELSITVTDYFNNDMIQGLKISVDHRIYGTLFATVLDATGLIVTPTNELTNNLPNATILAELAKFGFFVTFDEELNLSKDQIRYLITIRRLDYDKLRLLTVVNPSTQTAVTKVVAFQVDPLGDWLNNAYEPSEKEFLSALDDGTAINLTDISKTKQFRWDWLKDLVVNIDDVIRDNAEFEFPYAQPLDEDDD